jgi:cyclophilin family peptidyl-prolyl cis-trans isomerase
LTIELYPGVSPEQIKKLIKYSNADNVIYSKDYLIDNVKFHKLIQDELTNDRVFGKMTKYNYEDFIDKNKIKELNIDPNKKTLIIGIASSLIKENESIIYVDVTR